MPDFKCLVIEDDLFYRTYVADLLSDLEIKIITAADGEAGLALVFSEKPDLIITDTEIPKVHGFVLLRMIRENPETRNIPVIMMSGKLEKDLLEEHSRLREHADGYLVKPFPGQELMALVEKAMPTDTVINRTSQTPEKDEGRDKSVQMDVPVEPIAQRDAGRRSEIEAHRPLRALVIDDSRYVCDIAGEFLREIGFVVKRALDGEEGLREALDYIPDLVLLDVQMPKMNGFEVCEMLRKEETTRDTIVVLMSAIVGQESFEKHAELRYPADAYLHKPFMKSELQDIVSRLVPGTGVTKTGFEGRTGFLIPPPDETAVEPDEIPSRQEENSEDKQVFAEMRSSLDSLKVRERELEAELNSVRVERDVLEDEAFTLRSSKEDREKELQNKITLLTQRFEECRSQVEVLEAKDSEYESLKSEMGKASPDNAGLENTCGDMGSAGQLERECRELRRDLAAAISAKNEIEDQVKYILERRLVSEQDGSLENRLAEVSAQNADLLHRAQEAESTVRSLRAVESQLERTRKEQSDLKTKLEESEQRSSAEILSLKSSLSEAVKRSGDLEDVGAKLSLELKRRADRIDELEGALKNACERAEAGEADNVTLRCEMEKLSTMEDRLEELVKVNDGLQRALENSEKLRSELELKIGGLTSRVKGEDGADAGKPGERLEKLETALKQTVLEAQSVIDQQNVRENQLQETMRSLMSSLEEDREAFRQEKEGWRDRERELRTALDDALAENRRVMGEEASGFYPMLMPQRARPLEVVTGTRKYWVSAALAALLLAVLVLGYMQFTRTGEKPQTGDMQGIVANEQQPADLDGPPLPKAQITTPVDNNSFENMWRRQTVRSVSNDIMIQATLHTLQELEAAIMYVGEKEGWTGQRKDNALQELTDTFKVDNNYYVTVYSKNLREGYPGYTDIMEKHIALRDHTGRETMAVFPAEPGGSKFITSRVSAAAKEMSPDFLNEAGMTISFSKKELAEKPEELQLVIYDVGAVPMRVLTWETSSPGW